MVEQAHEHPWYVAVFLWLGALTLLEVGVTYLGLGRGTLIAILSVLAVAKAGLVALYFMHLKFERSSLILFVTTPLVCVLLLIAVVAVDALRIVP